MQFQVIHSYGIQPVESFSFFQEFSVVGSIDNGLTNKVKSEESTM